MFMEILSLQVYNAFLLGLCQNNGPWVFPVQWGLSVDGELLKKQEEFLRCQTTTSAVRLEVEGCRVKNGGWRMGSEEWIV